MSVAARDAGPAKRGAATPPARTRQTATKAGGRTKAPAVKRRSRTAAPPPTRALVAVTAAVLWAIALVVAVALSSFLTALLLGAVAVVATASGIRATDGRARTRSRGKGRSASRRPSTVLVVALAAAALDPLVALAGPVAALAVILLSVGAIAAMVLSSGYAASARPLRAVGSRLLAALAPAVAATSVVVARHQGSDLALALICAALAYDAGAFLMGNSRAPLGGPVGVAFGVLSVAVVAIFVAAVMNPPFFGSRPWVVFALVAVAAPVGVRLGQMVGERLPAVRRMDSLLVAAPVWVVASALLLHR